MSADTRDIYDIEGMRFTWVTMQRTMTNLRAGCVLQIAQMCHFVIMHHAMVGAEGKYEISATTLHDCEQRWILPENSATIPILKLSY